MFKIDINLAEFYGILLGDGCICKHKSSTKTLYAIKIDGNSETDKDYYKYLQKLIKKVTNRDVKINKRKVGKCIFITFCHKEFANFLHKELSFPYGKKNILKIPKIFKENKKMINHLLKGFFDTDGCIYFTKNNSKIRKYPIIELSTHNKELLEEFKKILTKKGFNVKISHYKDSVKLHGKKNVIKWMEEIGSNNIDKYSKYIFWKKYGYCPKITELSLKERLKLLNEPEEI